MDPVIRWGARHAGCCADGAFGHQHVRRHLAYLLSATWAGETVTPGADLHGLSQSLQGEMPDDAWDELEALEILNGCTEEGYSFAMLDGDLVLLPASEADCF